MNKKTHILTVLIVLLIGLIFRDYLKELLFAINWLEMFHWSVDKAGFIQAITAISLALVAILTLY